MFLQLDTAKGQTTVQGWRPVSPFCDAVRVSAIIKRGETSLLAEVARTQLHLDARDSLKH